MNRSLRQFVGRILLIHAGLLAVLLVIVFAAAYEVYRTAHEQVRKQAQIQQELLADQTASGIKGFYDSIFSDLELFKPIDPNDEDVDDRTPDAQTRSAGGTAPPGQTGRGRGSRGVRLPPRMRTLEEVLPLQLNGRVAHLFLLSNDDFYAIPRGLGKQATNVTVQDIVKRNRGWIDSVDQATLISLEQFEDSNHENRGFSLIGVPMGLGDTVLVATVPVRQTARRFFDEVNQSGNNLVFLLDEKMIIMAASKSERIGGSIDAQAAAKVAELSKGSQSGSGIISSTFAMGARTFAPAMITVHPVKVLDKQWSVVLVQPLAEVDEVQGPLFHKAAFWSIFAAISMTAILVSSALQLIRNRARSERERHALLEKELRQAREIQLQWLPRPRPKDGVIDIATINQPASRISGDFYNWFDLPGGRTAVVIGDVTGHGMAAAFLMATTQLLVRNTLPLVEDPGRCLEEINRQLCTQVFNGQFVTLQILVLDATSGTIEIATAGHPAPLMNEGDGFQPIPLEPHLVLGVDKDARYSTRTISVSGPASVLLYTDGVVDAESPTEERFGITRLRRSLIESLTTAQELIDSVIKSINAFRGGRAISDDLTMVALHIQPRLSRQEPAVDHTSDESLQPTAI